MIKKDPKSYDDILRALEDKKSLLDYEINELPELKGKNVKQILDILINHEYIEEYPMANSPRHRYVNTFKGSDFINRTSFEEEFKNSEQERILGQKEKAKANTFNILNLLIATVAIIVSAGLSIYLNNDQTEKATEKFIKLENEIKILKSEIDSLKKIKAIKDPIKTKDERKS